MDGGALLGVGYPFDYDTYAFCFLENSMLALLFFSYLLGL
jgi:hypothetical protein